MNLDDRRELDTLHALDDLESRHELKERSILERLHILDDLKELKKELPILDNSFCRYLVNPSC